MALAARVCMCAVLFLLVTLQLSHGASLSKEKLISKRQNSLGQWIDLLVRWLQLKEDLETCNNALNAYKQQDTTTSTTTTITTTAPTTTATTTAAPTTTATTATPTTTATTAAPTTTASFFDEWDDDDDDDDDDWDWDDGWGWDDDWGWDDKKRQASDDDWENILDDWEDFDFGDFFDDKRQATKRRLQMKRDKAVDLNRRDDLSDLSQSVQKLEEDLKKCETELANYQASTTLAPTTTAPATTA